MCPGGGLLTMHLQKALLLNFSQKPVDVRIQGDCAVMGAPFCGGILVWNMNWIKI